MVLYFFYIFAIHTSLQLKVAILIKFFNRCNKKESKTPDRLNRIKAMKTMKQ